MAYSFLSLISWLLVIRTISTVVILNVLFPLFLIPHLPDWPFLLFFFSLSFYRAAPGAMANHLITNALLRPHGTNNPYNTLLGESAVYNNPSVSMYNAQGVLEFLSNFSSENSIFCGLFWPISFFFFFLFFFPTHTHTLCFFGTGHKKRSPPLPFISMHPSIFWRLFSMSDQIHFETPSSVLLTAFVEVLFSIFNFPISSLLF